MPKNVPISDAVTNMGALTLLLNGLKAGNAELIKEGMFDKLHEPYRWKLIKGGLEVKDAALQAGCLLYTSPSPRDQEASRLPASA